MSNAAKFPTFSRWGRFLWRRAKPWVRPVVFTLVCIVTLVALVVAEENYRTGRAWENYKAAARARGEKLTLAELAPPPVPDDQNFAMTPLLKPLYGEPAYESELSNRLELSDGQFSMLDDLGSRDTSKGADWAKLEEYLHQPDAMADLKKHDGELAEITQALRRPYSRFPISYDQHPIFSLRLVHVSPLIALGRLFLLRACAEFADGQSDQAMSDAVSLLRLSQVVRNEPIYMSKLVEVVLIRLGTSLIWVGLADRRWNESQLATLQDELQKIDLLTQFSAAQQGERVFFIDTLEWLAEQDSAQRVKTYRSFLASNQKVDWATELLRMPHFILNKASVAGSEYFDQYLLPILDLGERRFYPERAALAAKIFETQFKRDPFKGLWQTSSLFYPQIAYAQTSLDEAILACALERYHLSQGNYPEKLDVLVPQYISRLPHDLVSGKPLIYQLSDKGRFILYSTGWTGKDNQGKLKSAGDFDIRTDNWVWQYPPP